MTERCLIRRGLQQKLEKNTGKGFADSFVGQERLRDEEHDMVGQNSMVDELDCAHVCVRVHICVQRKNISKIARLENSEDVREVFHDLLLLGNVDHWRILMFFVLESTICRAFLSVRPRVDNETP